MPNWVHNTTKIIGDKKAVENCVASLEGEVEYIDGKADVNVFDFENIEPMPEEVRNTEPDRFLGGEPKTEIIGMIGHATTGVQNGTVVMQK